jgi:hypothetical protein
LGRTPTTVVLQESSCAGLHANDDSGIGDRYTERVQFHEQVRSTGDRKTHIHRPHTTGRYPRFQVIPNLKTRSDKRFGHTPVRGAHTTPSVTTHGARDTFTD